MKTINYKIILFFCLTIFTLACQKDVEVFIPDVSQNDKANLKPLLNQNPNRYILDIGETSQFLSTNTGIIIEIPKESLLNEDGSLFTGQVVLETVEIETNHGIFNYEISSLTEWSYLIPDRIFKINFTHQEKPLMIDKNNPVLIKTTDKDDMISKNIFYWENNFWNIINPVMCDKWKSVIGENSIEAFGYNIQIDKNGWYAIGHEPINISEPGSKICAKTLNQFGDSNTIGYLFLKNKVISIPLIWSENESAFCTDKIAKSDIESGVIVLVSWQNNKYYFGIINIDKTHSNIIPCDLTPANSEYILNEISKL